VTGVDVGVLGGGNAGIAVWNVYALHLPRRTGEAMHIFTIPSTVLLPTIGMTFPRYV
jgi:hypothetical protein